ncbi:checkpoint clamp complex protein Rad1, partial [Dipsacomyces acuminosporus]
MTSNNPRTQQQQQQQQQSLFTARLNNVRPLVNMLKTLSFRPRTLCTVSEGGMVFTVEESQSIVAQAYLRTSIFTAFNYNSRLALQLNKHDHDEQEYGGNEEESYKLTQISLPLDNLIECLTLFYGPSGSTSHGSGIQSTSALLSSGNPLDLRGATTVQIAYNGPGSDFELMLEERGTISVCRLATFVPEPPVDLEFSSHQVTQQLIIRSEWLQDAFNELDPTSES